MNGFMKYGILLLLAVSSLAALAQGQIRGVVRTENSLAASVLVMVANGDQSYQEFSETDVEGRFTIRGVPAGTYIVQFSFPGLLTHTERDVQVASGSTVNLSITMEVPLNVMESLTVSSASRRPERIVEAPAAVTVVTSKEIQAQAAHGQLPKILESTPGVELAQSGVFDFNINARGFNSSLNRRILVLIDGRDPSTGFLGNQEWSALTFPLDELESIELVRGPGAALYGANAFNGVLNMRTKRPVDDLGGKFTLRAGSLSSTRADFRYSGEFGSGWSYRVNGGTFSSDTWSRSRTALDADATGNFEYAGLQGNREAVAFNDDKVESVYFSARVDKEFSNNQVLTVEGGQANIENALAVTGLGRVQVDEVDRPWLRINFNAPHYNLMYSYSGRETPQGQTSLSSGTKLWEDSVNQHFEIQANYDFFDDRLQVVGGAAYRDQEVDTLDKNLAGQGINHQTLMVAKRNEDQQSVFGQLTFKATEKLDLLLAGRWDDSTLHDAQESPKAAVVYKFTPNQSVRLTWGKAFQTANYSEFFLRAAAGVVPFGLLQDAVVLGGFGLDLRSVGQDGLPLDGSNGPPLLDWRSGFAVAVGNDSLVPEEIESWEIGYKGIIGSKLFLTVDYYQSEIINFITDLLPGVNSNIAAFTFNENIPAAIQQTLLATIVQQLGPLSNGLTNQTTATNPLPIFPGNPLLLPDGHPVVTLSYTNAGQVDTEGIDVALNYYINDNWTVDFNYSWFDFDIVDQLVGDRLLPNASENKYNIGLAYSNERITSSLKYHYVEEFPYAAGVFVGTVPSYGTLNFNLEYTINDSWRVGVIGNNITDDEHYELFGGSLNGSRGLATVNFKF